MRPRRPLHSQPPFTRKPARRATGIAPARTGHQLAFPDGRVSFAPMMLGSGSRPRLLPDRAFPPYAYLPGRFPHPLRHPEGHSYGAEPDATVHVDAALTSEAFRWGVDLFNFGYYWEAHEAWEGLWQTSREAPEQRTFLHALILLSAAGVKMREGKDVPALRHARRAARLLRALQHQGDFKAAIGMPPEELADRAEADALAGARLHASVLPVPSAAFEFTIVPD